MHRLPKASTELFLGVLPSWVGDLVTIIAIALGLPGVILWILNRRDAMRKLEVEEGGLKKSVFDSQTGTYQDLLDRAEARAKECETKVSNIETKLGELHEYVDYLFDTIRIIRDLFRRVIIRNSVVLTPEEEAEFQATAPKPRPRRSPERV